MTPRATRLLLWLAAFATLPVAYFLPEGEVAPILRLAFLTGLMSVVYIAEGPGALASSWILAIGQLVVWCALLYLGVRLVARLLGTFSDAARPFAALVVVVLLFGFSCMEIYSTPLSSSRLRSNILGLFE